MLFCALLGFEVNGTINRLPFFLKHGNIGLFFPDDFLDGLSLHISILSRTERIDIFVTLISPELGLRGLELIDEQSDSFIDLCRL